MTSCWNRTAVAGFWQDLPRGGTASAAEYSTNN